MRSETNSNKPQMATAETHVPPQNLEAESSVLGAMMVAEGAIAPVILDVRLHDEDFYRERHRIVFRAITGLYEQGEPVDALTVSEYLAQHGDLSEAGGKEAVSELASTVPVPGNARPYAQIVKQNALLRRLLATSQRIQKSVHDREGDPEQLVERAESLLFRVAHEERASDFRRVAEVLGDEIDRLEALSKGDRELTGAPSGFRALDDVIGGFQPGNLVIVDYIQLMRPEDTRVNRVEQVGQVSRGLKILARELGVPVIGVSQLSRAPEQRPDKRPMLSDLRESGSIEQDADVVTFIYRASKYDDDADPSEADLIVAKHRNGPTADVPVVFLEQYPRFVDRAGSGERPVEQKPGEGPPLIDLAEEA